jgi:putative ABC transport system ATP-binding protein
MYTLKDVTKTFQKGRRTVHALHGVSTTINDGELIVIQGPTGHGKTTLLQMLGGLDRPTDGVLEFDGDNMATMRERQLSALRARSFGFVFQFFNLIPTLSAQENVEVALVPTGVKGAARREAAVKALTEVGLDDRLSHLPSELSGGQQQRVAIARALAKEPKVILADEPTGNLDEDTRDEIVTLLEKLWKERGMTMIIVSHDSTIARWAPKVAALKKGRLSIKKDTKNRAATPS